MNKIIFNRRMKSIIKKSEILDASFDLAFI